MQSHNGPDVEVLLHSPSRPLPARQVPTEPQGVALVDGIWPFSRPACLAEDDTHVARNAGWP